MVRSVRLRLYDIAQTGSEVQRAIAGRSLEDFEADWTLRLAIERGMEIISEASRHLPASFKAEHPGMPWRQIADLGNVLRHAYHRVDAEILWSIIADDLEPLLRVVREALATLPED